MPAHRWRFFDPNTLEDEEFPLNPNELTLPSWEKSVDTSTMTTAPDGRAIVTEGPPVVGKFQWSGITLDLTQADFFTRWHAKPYQIQFTDDFARVWWIYITKFGQTRGRHSVNYPEKHAYSFEAVVLDWPD